MKSSVVSLPFARVAVCGALLVAFTTTAVCVLRAADKSASASSAPQNLARELMGTWVHVGEPGKVGETPAKGGFIKLRTARHWAAISIDPKAGLVESTHGGTWKVEGSEYQETTEYGGEYQSFIMNKTFKWKVAFEGETMTMTGLDNEWHEVWKRVK